MRTLIAASARRLRRAQVFFGHGTDNAEDEAAALVWHALDLPHPASAKSYARRVGVRGRKMVKTLIERRIRERIPAAYLTGESGFAGLCFRVDARVLIPRSALAELIERRFSPWIEARTRAPCARHRHRLGLHRDRLCAGFSASARGCGRREPLMRSTSRASMCASTALHGAYAWCSPTISARSAPRSYDIIVSNPPYVGARELDALPAEYRYEPRIALAAGKGGLDSIRIILRDAARHLRPRGILVVEAGNTEFAVRRAFRGLPFTWLEFERGGGGVFLLTAEQLHAG